MYFCLTISNVMVLVWYNHYLLSIYSVLCKYMSYDVRSSLQVQLINLSG